MSSLLNKLSGSPSSKIPDFPPTKRISTPAGDRLSTILEYGAGAPSRTRNSMRNSLLSGPASPGMTEHADEGASGNSGYTTTTVWSEGGEKLVNIKENKHIAKRGGWKRLAIYIGILILILLALIIGLVVGLKKKHHSSQSSSDTVPAVGAPTPSPTSSAIPVVTPSNFPLGSYSFVTFFDSSYTNCTANPATWTCYPYNTYYSNPSSALAVFNWIITAKPGNSKAYQISSTDNPFSISFQNVDLRLDDSGLDTEHYTFQLTDPKTVSPSSPITSKNIASTCYYNQTTLQAYLYTRQSRSYPTDQTQVTGASYTQWPARVRVEQVASGGDNVPSCYTMQNGTIGAQITDGLKAQDPSSLCSCLYKNWFTPT